LAELFTSENLIALLALTSLEIVLGIDNVVFLAIVTSRLRPEQQSRARRIGLLLAMVMRIVLLFCIKWIMGLKAVLFTVFSHDVAGRDLILLFGGLFLIGKATFEVHERIEGHGPHPRPAAAKATTFGSALVQILLLDLVFSLDSVITAVGMARHIAIMVVAVIAAVLVMLAFADSISRFIERHPTMKMLALSFLLLIGVMLVAEGCGKHIEKGYIYFAMGFSLVVELLNIRVHSRSTARSAT
jgi:predicted tellurium resistance membrane protein TerC